MSPDTPPENVRGDLDICTPPVSLGHCAVRGTECPELTVLRLPVPTLGTTGFVWPPPHAPPVKPTPRDWSVPPPDALPISSSAREEFPRGAV